MKVLVPVKRVIDFNVRIRVVAKDTATVTREIDGRLEALEVTLPAVITTDLRLNEPRYVSLPTTMKAKKKLLDRLRPETLDVDISPRLQVGRRCRSRGQTQKRDKGRLTMSNLGHDNTSLRPTTLCTVSAAVKLGGDIHVLLAGERCSAAAVRAANIEGVSEVQIARHLNYADAGAENLAFLVFPGRVLLDACGCWGRDNGMVERGN
jgi:Electron transfer flavoprotein domain